VQLRELDASLCVAGGEGEGAPRGHARVRRRREPPVPGWDWPAWRLEGHPSCAQ